jgi:predicted O-methyltransferase YrrM
MKTLANIAANSLRRRNFPLMVEKVIRRMTERGHAAEKNEAASWCAERAESWPDFARSLDAALWQETEQACADIARAATKKLEQLGLDLGGGGHYPLLYFLTRHAKAKTVIETGVAAGWSSQAILTALGKNGPDGYLYSSDFPYFRLKNPEQYVGYVVDEGLKDRWTLLIDGDRNNLPAIMKQVRSVDLFHYDSDKSYAGRAFAWDCVKNKCTPDTIVIFDDIQDNFHFRDFAETLGRPFRIFGFEGKYVALISPRLSAPAAR